MPLQLPHPDSLLHLYRHVLREVTYLPPFVRPWVKERVQTKFRDNRRPNLKKAHHGLRFLRSANSGHYDRMRHIFYLATGRKGKRNRELSRTILAKEPASSSDALHGEPLFPNGESLTEKSHPKQDAATSDRTDRPPDWLDNWDKAKIQVLSQSQVEAGVTQIKKMRGNWNPDRAIPKENAWGLPFHPKTARRKELKHYASLLSQLMPPLPKGEWEALRALAIGEADASMYRIPPRRPVAVSTAASRTERPESTWKWEDYVMRPVRSVERKGSRKMKSLTGVEGLDPRGPSRPVGVRALKSRAMRRGVYTRVWEASPLLGQNARGKWEATYGGHQRLISKPSGPDLAFFAEIPGDVATGPKRRTPPKRPKEQSTEPA